MPVRSAEFVARLAIGEDKPSRVHSNLETQEQLDEFGMQLASHTAEFTKTNTADCMEDRRNILLAGSIDDLSVIEKRVVPQGPGGLGLMLAKAAVAADLAFVRDAKNMKDAYMKTVKVLDSLGFEDGGHAKCGASTYVEQSVAQSVNSEILIPTIGAVIGMDEEKERVFKRIQETKQRRLEDGFYSDWDPAWHEQFLMDKFPQNFMHIEVTDDPTKGHHADGIGMFDGVGFAKNEFISHTGKMAFAFTRSLYPELQKTGGTAEERLRLLVALPDDLINVSDKIVAPDMPVFAVAV